jgi:hypothetical protein
MATIIFALLWQLQVTDPSPLDPNLHGPHTHGLAQCAPFSLSFQRACAPHLIRRHPAYHAVRWQLGWQKAEARKVDLPARRLKRVAWGR